MFLLKVTYTWEWRVTRSLEQLELPALLNDPMVKSLSWLRHDDTAPPHHNGIHYHPFTHKTVSGNYQRTRLGFPVYCKAQSVNMRNNPVKDRQQSWRRNLSSHDNLEVMTLTVQTTGLWNHIFFGAPSRTRHKGADLHRGEKGTYRFIIGKEMREKCRKQRHVEQNTEADHKLDVCRFMFQQ